MKQNFSNTELAPRKRRWALLSLMCSVGMATLDTAIVNTVLPTIANDLHIDAATSIWVILTYQLAMVSALLPLASLGDKLGYRRIYLAGLCLFIIASLACGLAGSLSMLALARGIQGLGAAAIMSVNAALLRFMVPADRLGRAFGMNAVVVGLGFVAGPTFASVILSLTSWPWLFLINIPIGLISLALSLWTLPQTQQSEQAYDLPAAVLTATLFAALILGLGEATHAAPWWIVLIEWGVAAGCLLWLLRRQANHPAPMLPVDLFRRPLFALSALTAICSFCTQGLAFVGLPFLFQHMLGRDQIETGYLMTPWPLLTAAMGPLAGRLVDRYPAGILCGIGLFIMSIGMGLLATLPTAPHTSSIVWRMAVCGLGFGLFQSPNLKAIIMSAPAHRSGAASGIIGMARLLGQSMGAALVALCFYLVPNDVPIFNTSTLNAPALTCWIGAVIAGLGSVVSLLRVVALSSKSLDDTN